MTDKQLAETLCREAEIDPRTFSSWEIDFISRMSDLAGSGRLLTPKQREKLEEIYEEKMR